MKFLLQEPNGCGEIVKWFWMAESENRTVREEKIIPDGFPEIVFHYGDPFEINISGSWQTQGKNLLAGQIRKFFHLRNTGTSGMFAIKIQPWAVFALFNRTGTDLIDQVAEFPMEDDLWREVSNLACSDLVFDEKCEEISKLLMKLDIMLEPSIMKPIKQILNGNGLMKIEEIVRQCHTTERTLERIFKKYIGLTPKRYCRIIRHAYIFKLITEKSTNWAELATTAGYFDQTHFIKNFQEFTGEDPSKYGFNETTMANFHLK